ncbi:FkbM family methyltransferase [Natrialba sp. SSL1]|uniref:FkbM family methyltransferase n=1 Tax=Natrialba sp. SSL1 TaxID=1869245 RepID=UPI001495DF40|nr:FkbM family methyltransferase [Natrialba sp. SSL1]
MKDETLLKARSLLQWLWESKTGRAAESLGLKAELKRVYDAVDTEATAVISFDVAGETIDLELETVAERDGFDDYQGAEKPLMASVVDTIGPDDVFYDVGAYIGTYSALVATAEPEATVHAFEPGPHRRTRLRRTQFLNDTEFTIHDVALSNKSTNAYLTSGGRITNDPATDISQEHKQRQGQKHQHERDPITVAHGDTYVRNQGLELPTVMKIDVEGGELQVLEGLTKTLPNCRDLFIEVHPQDVANVEALFEFLSIHGFTANRLFDRENVFFIHAQ